MGHTSAGCGISGTDLVGRVMSLDTVVSLGFHADPYLLTDMISNLPHVYSVTRMFQYNALIPPRIKNILF